MAYRNAIWSIVKKFGSEKRATDIAGFSSASTRASISTKMLIQEILTDYWKLEVKPWAAILRNPFTDVFGCMLTHSSGLKCAEYEARLGDCMEAYGPQRGVDECRVYMNDLMECSRMSKQLARVQAMQTERQRQYKAGERPDRYAPPPKIDAY